jgi:predicted Rossmann-fold nucleotide-binding protein
VKTICINLGSNPGNDRLYVKNTIILAKTLLEEFLDNAVTEGFIKKEHRNMIVFEKDADELIKKMKEIKVPLVSKWMDHV